MSEFQYCFYGQLNLVLNSGGHAGYEKYFNNEYQLISQSNNLNPSAPLIKVGIVRELPPPSDHEIRTIKDRRKLFSFSYVIRGIDTDEVEIYFCQHFMDKLYINAVAVFLQAQVLEPLMYYKLLQRGVLLMHAAGVTDGKAGYLFPAHGGTGKTTLSIALLAHGFKLLGDDLLFIDTNKGVVHPYPRPLHLFTYNINSLQNASVPFHYRTAIYFKNIIRYCLKLLYRTEFLISTRVHAQEIFSDDPFGSSVPYRSIGFLVKEGPTHSCVEIDSNNVEMLTSEILHSADLNESLYILLKSSPLQSRVVTRERQLVDKLLRQFPHISYINTRAMALDQLVPSLVECLRERQQ
ncbi:phosphoenolpyruvate carboxykinase [Thiorhodovibrio frisius]|uniref:Phosphoenolpyruvate carboxykinase n=1 Tax=Thiorhodovibrio frisius TaxID=631362 RepID=H8Z0I3_9GAMM|nr:phosphoenolpyruvate carboxykinase [Thiorhodovibrio frisius]EIC21284.1 Phosphoenolpyruvate carboxykinase [Thiorhodovibrio frisius]WPL23863.1 hypothetical protein Thiofri_04070 [Thiorhodovibrio frisius]